jgi:hypothetical protein
MPRLPFRGALELSLTGDKLGQKFAKVHNTGEIE